MTSQVKPLEFWGTAHPPPSSTRGNVADLSSAEISTTQMGLGNGTDVLVEHDHANRVGSVMTSWEGRDGSLQVAGKIFDPKAIEDVRSGKMRGLSLGTSVIQDASGNPLYRSQDEISICVEPRRGGCFINRIDGNPVRTVACFSEQANNRESSALAPAPRANPFDKPNLPFSLEKHPGHPPTDRHVICRLRNASRRRRVDRYAQSDQG